MFVLFVSLLWVNLHTFSVMTSNFHTVRSQTSRCWWAFIRTISSWSLFCCAIISSSSQHPVCDAIDEVDRDNLVGFHFALDFLWCVFQILFPFLGFPSKSVAMRSSDRLQNSRRVLEHETDNGTKRMLQQNCATHTQVYFSHWRPFAGGWIGAPIALVNFGFRRLPHVNWTTRSSFLSSRLTTLGSVPSLLAGA